MKILDYTVKELQEALDEKEYQEYSDSFDRTELLFSEELSLMVTIEEENYEFFFEGETLLGKKFWVYNGGWSGVICGESWFIVAFPEEKRTCQRDTFKVTCKSDWTKEELASWYVPSPTKKTKSTFLAHRVNMKSWDDDIAF